MAVETGVNLVKYLQSIKFSQLSLSEKVEIKEKGRHTPALCIIQKSTSRNKEYMRQFSVSVYEKSEWLCGCDEKNALLFSMLIIWRRLFLDKKRCD